MSHGDHKSHKAVVDLVREYNRLNRRCLAVMLDTKGPEVRSGDLAEPLEMRPGKFHHMHNIIILILGLCCCISAFSCLLLTLTSQRCWPFWNESAGDIILIKHVQPLETVRNVECCDLLPKRARQLWSAILLLGSTVAVLQQLQLRWTSSSYVVFMP